MTTSAVKPPPALTPQTQHSIARGALFGGYSVVAVVAAWLVGIALRASDILPPYVAPWTWLALAGACAMLATLGLHHSLRRIVFACYIWRSISFS